MNQVQNATNNNNGYNQQPQQQYQPQQQQQYQPQQQQQYHQGYNPQWQQQPQPTYQPQYIPPNQVDANNDGIPDIYQTNLPPGFEARIDQQSGRPYWVNHATQQSQWNDPRQPYA